MILTSRAFPVPPWGSLLEGGRNEAHVQLDVPPGPNEQVQGLTINDECWLIIHGDCG